VALDGALSARPLPPGGLEQGLSVAEIAKVATMPHDVVASISAEHPGDEVS
jgi:hypothetical protein